MVITEKSGELGTVGEGDEAVAPMEMDGAKEEGDKEVDVLDDADMTPLVHNESSIPPLEGIGVQIFLVMFPKVASNFHGLKGFFLKKMSQSSFLKRPRRE